MTTFADIPEQAEAKRLLEAALAEGSAHAYLFHGPAGVGKRQAAKRLTFKKRPPNTSTRIALRL